MSRPVSLTKWLVGTLTAIALSLFAWGGTAIISNSTGLAEVRADQKSDREFIKDRLDRLEDKFDRLDDFLRKGH